MRKHSLLLLLLLLSLQLFCQRNLSGSRQNSYYTYIYRISLSETSVLCNSGMGKADEKYLHTLVDSFPTSDDKPPALKDGNYLFVKAEDNHLSYELKTIDDVQLKLINNSHDLAIALCTKQSQLINDATVSIGNKKIGFDTNTKTYRIAKRNKTGLVKVEYHGVLHLFPLKENAKSYYGRPSFISKLANTFPLKYITRPVKKILARHKYRYGHHWNSTAYEQKFTGFMVFSKPKYKPGDTVKLKAYVMNKNGKPVNRPLLVRLAGRDLEKDTILTELQPYRPGGFDYQFVITDSLDLQLDDEQSITLEEIKSKKFDLKGYEGDLDDDEYVAKRKVLMRGKFTYEDYELRAVRFTARADKEEQHRGSPLAVYLKATDENDMAVMDGRVQLIVLPDSYGNKSFHAPSVFLPDTLWSYSQPLEALGETKIIIPDSIFPAASFGYHIDCIFLNGNNEYQTVTLSQNFDSKKRSIYFTPIGDSLKIEQKLGEVSEIATGVLYSFDENEDTLQQQAIGLPATVSINLFAKSYEIETDSAYEEFEVKEPAKKINCLAARTSDSINIQVINKQHLFFWYSIFAGNKVIKRGYADSLSYIEKTHTAKNYFVSLQYIYGDKVFNNDYTVPYQKKLLNVQVRQPQFVYPGQHVTVEISVTNKSGKPVKNADITAYSFTDKFEDARAPFVPYLGKIYPGRKRYQNFFKEKQEDITGNSQLNWERWSREMGLDSIEYFKFLHPGNIYTNTEPAADSITQLAPFVVIKGDLQPVHQIYIDETPYFFSQAEQLQRYSFKVSPGKHALRLRTHNRLIKIDSVWAFKGVKTFLSINADTATNKTIDEVKMPDSLNYYEKSLWSKYMLLVENDFGEAPATITQSNLLYFLNPQENNQHTSRNILVGPLPATRSNFTIKNQFTQSFDAEGNYLFNINKGLIKQKQLPFGNYAFSKLLSSVKPHYNFHDFVLTQKGVDSLWQDYLDKRNANEDLFRNEALNKNNNGRLQMSIDRYLNGQPVFVKSIFLFRYDDADFVRVYKGVTTDLGYVQPGFYRVFILLKGDDYYLKDSIEIKKDGINYYEARLSKIMKRDSMSTRIASIVNGRGKNWRSVYQDDDLDLIKESFNEKYLDEAGFSKYIYGTVKEIKSGDPVTGATVTVKGTKFGTSTDRYGAFKLKVPEKGTLVIAGIGYQSVEKRINAQENYEIKMAMMTSALNEVVVVGYGIAKKSSLTSSVSTISGDNLLMGRVAGLQINIRGIATVDGSVEPLFIVDGIPFSGKLDTALIASVNVLKSEAAVALYGSRAANGVVIITTKKASQAGKTAGEPSAPLPGNMLRKNFRDAAYWQPRLQTDKNGKASFETVFPDDITKWRTFVIAMGDKKQTGFAEGFVKSFKAISAGLSVPAFAVEGDSINVIGKVLNYTLDSMRVQRSFSTNESLQKESMIGLHNSLIDTLAITAGANDSLKLKYTIQKTDGYFDGEERSIPIYKQGVQETKGFFAALDADTSFTLSFNPEAGKIQIYAESSVLPVLLDEIGNIHRYEYLCNEQLASKLKALLLKKKIWLYLKKDFKEEDNINAIIKKLNQGKSQAGLWGWWVNNDPSLWISHHAIEALLLAEKDGYIISMNKDIIKDYLIYNFDRYNAAEQIASTQLLKLLGAKVDFKKYIDTLERKKAVMNMYQQLQLLQLKQQLSIPVIVDTILAKFKTTMFGNMYWGEENNRFFDNSIQNTLLVYRVLKTAGGYEKQLKKIRNYFLERRKDGNWRNTYESSLVLETILPDILKNDAATGQPTIGINNLPAVQSFPYTTTVGDKTIIQVKKQGNWPVYFTAYQQFWNTAPTKKEGDFKVNSFFEKNGQKLTVLKAGEPVIMHVDVTVKGDADYVMIEIPIPAGCSYKDKTQFYSNNEVHREYFKNKVSLFCSSLRKGQYSFTVSLLPRYTGSYHLNPAKAEMMYFPVFYGREGMKKVRID